MTEGILYAAPVPFVDESFSSWMQRLCVRHACSIGWAKRFLEMSSSDDLDLDLRPRHLSRIMEVTGAGNEWGYWARFRESARNRFIRQPTRTKLATLRYRWCPACLSDDEDPYFRLAWRFGSDVCFTHGTRLIQECASCGGHPNLNVTVHYKSLDLSYCQHCGFSLAGGGPVQEPRFRAEWLEKSELGIAGLQEELSKRLKRVKKSLRPTKRTSGKPMQSASGRTRKPPIFLWEIKGEYRPARNEFSLVLDGSHFFEPTVGARKKWSAAIPRGTKARSVMAAALHLLRIEKRAAAREARRSAPILSLGGGHERAR